MTDTKHMTCPDCERYKASAKNWRYKAYELSGHPLPWEGGETWVGLTHEEMYMNCPSWLSQEQCKAWIHQIEAKLKEKNT